MLDPSHVSKFEAALTVNPPFPALFQLATDLRDRGMSQLDLYMLFSHFQQTIPDEDPRYDAIPDTMDLIWGGPWAKGNGLFSHELSSQEINEYRGKA